MHAWSAPEPPELPGRGLPVRVYDTASAQSRQAATGPAATMYVCGITPYDATHLGHAATYVAFDVLHRAWRDAGVDVTYVQNVTDIDDPLLDRARETGQDWRELADQQTELFTADMAWLRVLPPQRFVGAVDSIPLITELIERMRSAGAVYEVDGDLYFSVRADPRFGEVARLDDATMRELFAERGGDPARAGKKDELDCLVWQRARPGEPSWDSPFGAGRPGWHVECTAIALQYLGVPFDVQGGGNDLAFPHHEMSASHGHLSSGTWPFAHAYVHAGMMALDGQKMSKSQGNLVFASELRHGGQDPAAVRLGLLSGHYRADREWNDDVLARATRRLEQWRTAAAAPSGPDVLPLLSQVRQSLADDLDTPAALAAVDGWAEQTLRDGGGDESAPELFRTMADALLGISL
ncbi:L-cysteine:1D-myo-inositol 2-amino-2-deoxy-alpha-D-glucopyranoside ligase [Haloactinopolyspora alba]|uniref:L-cysteine:1D-myo-inositol 2-amino-2-deoxy-alpha-D-glucopyranoside ligase n=1 Tax=Haloactinopolyspora alba TaxID=648780 RepID=A0A2P8D9B3_9ACTN|nr:cysteine--1-D-myo-inosityl 2-amino-2-deoxy-alpha-D-glucopyranoside ligase [Haloactinopolyspora alba]PSK93818.1 L-cysteine:1D-myo-inositol 2-amino-2-deoxy-alpha-D-glucopyranoside ligase [Haloactinopolyspora alba]